MKELYASAAYEDALSAVGKIDGGGDPNLEAEQYRVFCLVALGRMDEAGQAVEEVLNINPEYRPDAAQASPRIQSLFSEVRRRIGPALGQTHVSAGASGDGPQGSRRSDRSIRGDAADGERSGCAEAMQAFPS